MARTPTIGYPGTGAIAPVTSIAPVRTALRRSARIAGIGLLVVLVLLAGAGSARAQRCSLENQLDVCLGANPVCPSTGGPVGLAQGSWPVFQQNLQHTGASPLRGPTCENLVWRTKLRMGKVQSAMTLAPAAPGRAESLFVPIGKAPICALDPATGSVRWCETDNVGKKVDRGGPVVGNGDKLYVGTRDNDLWALLLPIDGVPPATVAWRQKVCTDGDVTTPPIISPTGTVYMGSDSLSAGTLIAMCPGADRQVKWCLNPVGGGIRNTSPALSADASRLYVTISSTTLGAFDPETGAEIWRAQLEKRAGGARTPNYSPVVHPVTGRIYLGLKSGLWEVSEQIDPGTGQPIGVGRLLLDTWETAQLRMYSPPALDTARSRLVFGATWTRDSALYATDLEGNVLWTRNDLGPGMFRNNPPVIDADGRIYFTYGDRVWALRPDGTTLWSVRLGPQFVASPILGAGRLFVATVDGVVAAFGGCPG